MKKKQVIEKILKSCGYFFSFFFLISDLAFRFHSMLYEGNARISFDRRLTGFS